MKKIISLLILWGIILSFVMASPITAYGAAILYEEDFDSFMFSYADGWKFSGYAETNSYLQSEYVLSGTRAYKLIDEDTLKGINVTSPYIDIEAGKTYTAIADATSLDGGNMNLQIRYYDSDDKQIGLFSSGVNTVGAWSPIVVSGTAPEGAVKCAVVLATFSNEVATGCYDNIKLQEGAVWPVKSTSMEAPAQAEPVSGNIVKPEGDKLSYAEYNEKGDKLSDFSKAGFYAGEYEIPDSRNIEVAAVIEPSSDAAADDTARIQQVIDEVYNNARNDNFKVIKIKAGRYNINKSGISLKSGIILSGEGQDPEGTVFYATDKTQYTVIKIAGVESKNVLNTVHYITDDYVKAGSYNITVSEEDIKNYEVGDLITVYHVSSENWNKAMDMVGITNASNVNTSWTEGSADMKMERTITAINGNVITLDLPFYVPMIKEYSNPYIYKTNDSGKIIHVGIENLRIESAFDGKSSDESHADNAISLTNAKNCYVRDVSAKYFVLSAVTCGSGSKQITVKNCSSLEPVSSLAGSRRYAFHAMYNTQQILFTGCYSYNGRHDYIAHYNVTGPIVFSDNVSESSNAQSEPHATWSTGVLYDNLMNVGGGWLAVTNRGIYGSKLSQGWTGAGVVMWNCLSPAILVQKPPLTYQNFIIGQWGNFAKSSEAVKTTAIRSSAGIYKTGSGSAMPDEAIATEKGTSFIGNAYMESKTAPVEPRSLYKAQLAETVTGSYKNTKPNAPVITGPRGETEHKLTSNAAVVKGIYEKGAEKVTVYIDNQAHEATLNAKDYTFELSINLADGVHKIYATQTINGVEGVKCADRFVVVKKLNGNSDYLNSQYDYNMIHQLKDDNVVSFDVYQNENADATADKIIVKVNGSELVTDVEPVEINGRVLVPMRAIFESFDADVSWDEATMTATATKETKVVQVTENSTVTKVDGVDVTIDVPATIIDGRFLVPVRFISESFGAKVEWIDLRRTVVITGGTVMYPPMHNLENELGIYDVIQSGDDGTSNTIEKTLDNNANTRWAVSSDNPAGAYGIFDLGFTRNVKSMYISFYNGDKRSYVFDISISNDGVNYTKVVENVNSSGKGLELEEFAVNASGRFVKLEGKGNSSNAWNNYIEIAITENR